MTDDIAACPHTLAERETAVADGMCPICAAEAPPPIMRPVTHTYKGRLTTLSLPEETAGLIEFLRSEARLGLEPCADEKYWCGQMEAGAATLRAQAQEIARLTDVQKSCHRDIIRQDDEIKQLKAEREAMRESRMVECEHLRKEARESRAKTFEECAELAFVEGCGLQSCTQCVGGHLADKYRTLAIRSRSSQDHA